MLERMHSDFEVMSNKPSAGLNGSWGSLNTNHASSEDKHSMANDESKSKINGTDGSLESRMLNGKANGSIDTTLNSSSAASGSTSPDNLAADPMLASAMISPLTDNPNLPAIFSANNAYRMRAPSITSNAHSTADDWELYKRAGPRYPPSLDALIMKHHRKHNNSWQLAHDLGAGSGVYASSLAKFFRHVHISDPSEDGIATSRKRLGQCHAADAERRGRFTFSFSAPEQAQSCTTDASVDLAVLCESAHFTDAEVVVRSIAKTLVPGGTLAIITHRPSGHVVGNERARQVVQRLFDAWGSKPWDVATGSDMKARQRFALGLDFVPLPQELYAQDKTRRITINTYGKASECFRAPDLEEAFAKLSTDGQFDMPTSRVNEKEKRQEYGEHDEYGRGWRQEMGWESFRTRIALLDSPETVKRLEPYLKEVQEVIEKTSPTGVTVVMEWSVAVVLATRK